MRLSRILTPVLLLLAALLIWKLLLSESIPKTTATPNSIASPVSRETQASSALPAPSSQPSGRLELTPPDLSPLLADAYERDQKKLPFRFATPLPVGKSSGHLAPWKITDNLATWELQVRAPDALSLNFAFDQFQMPPGGTLSLQSTESDEVITFTSQDNDDHGELWTPIFKGDTVKLTASLPATLLSDLRLSLASVNYGFRDKKAPKIGGDISGNCNVDVACDLNGIIDAYRDQIRSVGAYTLNGIDTCSGALINNTAEDSKPYFLTANHCEISTANDSSIVVYWNFENSTCRPPGSSNSGGVGDGDLSVFNTGSNLRANFSGSDVCLIELDDPVNPDSQAYFSGWDRSAAAPSQAVGIHHPAVAEKRISFEFDPLSLTNYFGTTVTSSGTHLRVADWDQGTTEGGSSGSPLFNSNGHIIGQLHGGNAACGNNADDWYGRLFLSWTGGGGSSSRLSNWLAPSGSQPTVLDGKELDIRLEANDLAISEGDSGDKTATITVNLSSQAGSPVTFTLTPSGGTSVAGSDYTDPGSQTVTITPPQMTATLELSITGDLDPEENETILLTFTNVTGASTPTSPVTVVITNDDFIPPVITSSLTLAGNEGSFLGYQIEASNTPTSYTISGQPSGMVVDSASGLVTWDSPLFGTYNFDISATNPADTTSETLTLTIDESLLKPAFEIPSAIAVGGDVNNWSITTSDTFDGEDALELTDASDASDTSLTLTVTGPDELTFWWKCSTEYLLDVFSVSRNGSLVSEISGETDWHPVTIAIPSGSHTLDFRYLRDSSIDGGFNTVSLDRFTLKSLADPVFQRPSPLYVEQGRATALHLPTFYENSSISTNPLPAGWSLLDSDHLSGTLGSDFTFSATANSALGSTTRSFQLTSFPITSSLQTALDQAALPLRSPAPSFFAQSTVRTTGATAARSATLSSEGRSAITASIAGPGTLRFQWRVSSEEEFDLGYVLLNGEQIAVDSGNNNIFTEVVVPLPYGLNEVTWLYVKDETVSGNLDALFLDNIRLEGYAKWVFDNGKTPFQVPPGSGTDGDANAGLIEYAVGLSPSTAEPPHLLDLSRSGGISTLSTPLDTSAQGVTLTIQKSPNLQPDSWFSLTSDTSPLNATLSTLDTSGDAKAFYRLHATAP